MGFGGALHRVLLRGVFGYEHLDLPNRLRSADSGVLGLHLQSEEGSGLLRMLFVVLTGIALIFVIGTCWYLSQTLVTQIASAFLGEISASSEGESMLQLVQWCNIVWGPAFIVLVIVWMVASAQARDVESEIYG